MPLCLVIGLGFYVIWTSGILIAPDPVAFPGYESSVLLLVTAVLIELMAEPLFIYAQIRSQFTIRIIAETSALLVRCIFLLGFVIFYSGDNDANIRANGSHILLAFSMGQVLGSICYSLIFWSHFVRQPDFHLHAFIPSFQNVSHSSETFCLSYSHFFLFPLLLCFPFRFQRALLKSSLGIAFQK